MHLPLPGHQSRISCLTHTSTRCLPSCCSYLHLSCKKIKKGEWLMFWRYFQGYLREETKWDELSFMVSFNTQQKKQESICAQIVLLFLESFCLLHLHNGEKRQFQKILLAFLPALFSVGALVFSLLFVAVIMFIINNLVWQMILCRMILSLSIHRIYPLDTFLITEMFVL